MEEAWAFFDTLQIDDADATFHRVMGRSMRVVPTSAMAAVKAALAIPLSRLRESLDDERAWKLLFALPRMIFYPVDKKAQANGASIGEQLKERCKLVITGNFEAAWRAFDWGAVPPARPPGSRDEELLELAEYMEDSVKDYNYSRAVRRVVSPGVAPASLDTVSRVATKCPQDATAIFSEHDTLLPSGGLGKADITVSAKQKAEIIDKWTSVLKSNPRRSAPAGDGWRNEHLLLALDAASDALPLLLEAIEAQRVPPQVRRHLATSRNLAFLKPDPNDPTAAPSIENGVRPICIPPAVRRTTARPMVSRVSGKVGKQLLAYGQVGCAIRAGVEIPPRILQCLIELEPHTCVDSEDCYNAFNELSRHEIAECIKQVDDDLYRYFLAYYHKPSYQFFKLANGTIVCPALSSVGVQQGDPAGSLIFDIVYTLRVLKPLRQAHPNATVFAIHDDTYLITATPDGLAEAAGTLARLAAPLGLRYGAAKRKLFQRQPADGDDTSLDLVSTVGDFPAGATIVRDAFKCGGIWVGTDEAVKAKNALYAAKYGDYVHTIAAAPCSRQVLMGLLHYCTKPSTLLNHHARVVRPELNVEAARAADEAMASAIARATRTDPNLLVPGLPTRVIEQLRLPASGCGGGGYSSLERLLPAAYLGSITDTLPGIINVNSSITGVFEDPSSWSSSLSPALAAAANSFTSVTSEDAFDDPRDLDKAVYNALTIKVNDPGGNVSSGEDQSRVPDISKLAAASGKHAQRLFSSALLRTDYHSLLNDGSVPYDTRRRICQASEEGALKFQHASPTADDRTLTDAAYLSNWRHCYGLDQPELYPGTRCTLTCSECGPSSSIDQAKFATGNHIFSCGCSAQRLRRHNGILRNVLKPFFQDMGWDWDESEIHTTLDTKERVDTLCRHATLSVKPLGIDATIGVPANRGGGAAVTNPHHTTDHLEKHKVDKHGAKCTAMGHDFLTAAFTSFGGWGKSIMAVLTKEYHKKKKEEKKRGGDGWAAQRWKQDLLERASISIANGNYNMLRGNRTLPTI